MNGDKKWRKWRICHGCIKRLGKRMKIFTKRGKERKREWVLKEK